MPSLKEEILILPKEGLLFYLSAPCRKFKVGGPYNPRTYYKTVSRLENEGLVEKFKKERKVHLRLTEQGKKFIRQHRKGNRPSSSVWDKKWRVIVFDIPE